MPGPSPGWGELIDDRPASHPDGATARNWAIGTNMAAAGGGLHPAREYQPSAGPIQALIGPYRVKPTTLETTRTGALMIGSNQYPACNGGGLCPLRDAPAARTRTPALT